MGTNALTDFVARRHLNTDLLKKDAAVLSQSLAQVKANETDRYDAVQVGYQSGKFKSESEILQITLFGEK